MQEETLNTIPVATQRQIERIAEVCERRKPLVVISCITYNHEAFLRDALEGFVMQQTDFPFVAIVHDDASTDGTAAVLREYAERYPDIILPIYEEENQYSKRNGTFGLIIKTLKAASGAKYVALCEGDDYWTSPDKLQRQVDFLESHPNYVICAHAYKSIPESKYNLYRTMTDDIDVSIKNIYDGIVQTATVMYRAELHSSEIYTKLHKIKKCPFGDYLLFFSALQEGKFRKLKYGMSVYRIHQGGANTQLAKYIDDYIRCHFEIANIIDSKDIIKDYFSKFFMTALIDSIKKGEYFNYAVFKLWKAAPFHCSKRLMVFLYSFLRYRIYSLKKKKEY